MSRIGKKPIVLPKGVTVKIEGNTVAVQGPKGKLDTPLPRGIKVEQKDGHLHVTATDLEMQITAVADLPGKDGQSTTVGARKLQDLLRALPEAGFARLSPAEGAFYLFADITERSNDSPAFCARMLAEAGIAVTPGVDFDHARGNRFLRFSYCGAEADMVEAADRLKRWG